MKTITIDRSKHIREQPHTGHNRWHPNVEPIIDADPGEEVVLETRDASDGNVIYGSEEIVLTKAGHPLTGPVYINGAQPGDLLEIEYLDIIPQPWGYTRFVPGRGFLPD
ncbi:MAG: acetamidase/formamidase family protein, partial [Dehalococcoidia bacterium]